MDPNDFNLNIRLLTVGLQHAGPDSSDCTSDDCGETPGSAGIANC